MLCRAIGALMSEDDIAGFELPIPCAAFKTTDCYYFEQRCCQKYEIAALRT